MKKTKNRKFPGVFLPGRMMRTMKLMTLLLVFISVPLKWDELNN